MPPNASPNTLVSPHNTEPHESLCDLDHSIVSPTTHTNTATETLVEHNTIVPLSHTVVARSEVGMFKPNLKYL